MKFLILATCVCMAVAAPEQRFAQSFAKASAVVTSPFVAAAQVSANAAPTPYNTGVAAVKYASGNDADAPVLRAESNVRPDGFNYITETGNGIKAEATGELKQIGETAAVVIRGQYSYTGPDGVPVVVTYVADQNGYQPQSDSIPVAPAVPEAIARSLVYTAAHTNEAVKKL